MRSSLKYTVTAAVSSDGSVWVCSIAGARSRSEADTTVKYSVAQGDYCYGEGGGEGEGEPKSVYLSIYLSIYLWSQLWQSSEFRVYSSQAVNCGTSSPSRPTIYLSIYGHGVNFRRYKPLDSAPSQL